MTRVMFVDDDVMFSRLVKAQLSKPLHQCELVFCDSAEGAFVELDRQPCDMIFSDMRMPEISGEEFLSQVAVLHPQTIRFAWSGQIQPEQLERIFQVAHQVMNKPTPRETLVEIILSLADFRARIANPPLLAFLTGNSHATLDSVGVQRVLDLIDGSDRSAKQIAIEIDKSPTAQARLLGIANSSLYSPAVAVCETERAIAMLGFNLVRAIIETSVLGPDYGDVSVATQATCTQCVQRGLEAASKISELVTDPGLNYSELNPKLIAALFHRFGQVQFSIFDDRGYADLQTECGDNDLLLIQRERGRYGTSRFDVAAYVLMLSGVDLRGCQIIASMGAALNDYDPTQP